MSTKDSGGCFVRIHRDTVKVVTDEIGTGGRLIVTDDTDRDDVRAWLETVYGTPEDIRANLSDDTDTAEEMLQALEDAADGIAGVATEYVPYCEYLGLSEEWIDVDELGED
mgnify:FL=1